MALFFNCGGHFLNNDMCYFWQILNQENNFGNTSDVYVQDEPSVISVIKSNMTCAWKTSLGFKLSLNILNICTLLTTLQTAHAKIKLVKVLWVVWRLNLKYPTLKTHSIFYNPKLRLVKMTQGHTRISLVMRVTFSTYQVITLQSLLWFCSLWCFLYSRNLFARLFMPYSRKISLTWQQLVLRWNKQSIACWETLWQWSGY